MNIDIKKWNPWNWFKHENEQEAGNVSMRKETTQERSGRIPSLYTESPLWNIHREIDNLFDDMFSQFGSRLPRLFGEETPFNNLAGAVLKPNVDIVETKKNYKISVEVPGIEENDVKLELANGALTITGEKKHEKEEKDEHYHSVERSYGSFRRVLSLPEDVNEEDIAAKFKNGVLTITVPRKQIAKGKEETKVINIKHAA